MALLPLPDNRCALIWTRPGKDAERLRGLDDAAFLGELQAAFGYRLGAFRQVGARHCYPLHLVEAREQVRPHLVVLGNAAHSLHPIAGQGFNLSLRDTLALVDALLHDDAPLGEFAVLQRYLDGQRLDQQMTVGFSDRVTRLFSNDRALLGAGRNLGLLGLDLLPPAKRWFARQAMGLGARPLQRHAGLVEGAQGPPAALRHESLPALPGAGIRVRHIAGDFREVRVRMGLNRLNRNYVGTQFGGSLYAMTDPFFMLMLMENLGRDYVVWDKAANIEFVSPGKGPVHAHFSIDQKLLDEVRERTAGGEKYLPRLHAEVRDDAGTLVARVQKTLYVRLKPRLRNAA